MKYAFQCRSCGRLEDSDNAAERSLPAACRSCGAGVSFDPRTGSKVYDEENWTVLADLPDDELVPILELHDLERKDIETHTPWPAAPGNREPMAIERETADELGSEDVAG